MTDYGLGNRKITDNFEVTLPSGRKTEFTRAKTEYIRYSLNMKKSDFANAPVALYQELDMLSKLRTLAEKEGFKQEFRWIDERAEEIKKEITDSKIETFAHAYYQPFFATEEMLNADNELMKLLNSCKISETEFPETAEEDDGKNKTKDLYHLGYLLNKCRDEDTNLVNPLLAKAVEILASADVECSKVVQFLDNNSEYDYSTKELVIDFETLAEVKDFKSKNFSDEDTLFAQKFLSDGFVDRKKVKEFIFSFKAKGFSIEDTVKILDALKVKTSNEEHDIKEESVDKLFILKKILLSTRKNEVAERKVAANSSLCDTFQIDEHTLFVRKERGFDVEDISDNTPEKLKQRYDETIEIIENDLLVNFANKYKNSEGLLDDKSLRVATSLRNIGVVYGSLLPLIDLSLERSGSINQSCLEAVKYLKGIQIPSAEIPNIIKQCPKNDDGTLHIDSLNLFPELMEVGFNSTEIASSLQEIKKSPELKDFFVDCGQLFEDKQNFFDLLPLTKDSMGQVDENSLDVIITLGFNIAKNFPKTSEDKIKDNISFIMKKIKHPETNVVSDDAAGICSILASNNFGSNSIKNVLYGCEESDGVYNPDLSEIVWKMGLEKATVVEITGVLAKCRMNDRTLKPDVIQNVLQMFEEGYKKEDIINSLNNE